MSADNINISFHQNTNVDLVKDFYRIKTDYRNFETVKRTDRTIISADKEIVIGVLRLCEENGIDILRGFNVQNEYQKKGIGLSMLIEAEKYMLERTCYLICKETLNSLYEKVGFYQTSEVPEFLKERMLSYNNDKLNIL
jgi:N-acetylglutamate synthase-like GNAT family acetyltransferase